MRKGQKTPLDVRKKLSEIVKERCKSLYERAKISERRRKVTLIKYGVELVGSKYGGVLRNTWHNEVLQRDEYTCHRCWETNKLLHAHHILSWSQFPGLRFNVSNGITFCCSCHRRLELERKRAIKSRELETGAPVVDGPGIL